jgi:hypothetical protein
MELTGSGIVCEEGLGLFLTCKLADLEDVRTYAFLLYFSQ